MTLSVGKKINILLIGSGEDIDCKVLQSIINDEKMLSLDIIFCRPDALEKMKSVKYSIILFDIKYCDIPDIVNFAKKIRELDSNCILVALINNHTDCLFDYRLIDIPIDDFIRVPMMADFLKEKILLWSIKYKKRYLCFIDLEKKMEEYRIGIQKMIYLENIMKETIGMTTNGRLTQEISSVKGRSDSREHSVVSDYNNSV